MLMQGYGFILQFDYGRILLYNKVIYDHGDNTAASDPCLVKERPATYNWSVHFVGLQCARLQVQPKC